MPAFGATPLRGRYFSSPRLCQPCLPAVAKHSVKREKAGPDNAAPPLA